MQIPQPHLNIKVRDIFRKIYTRGQINLAASKNYLEEQLNLYLDHLGSHTSYQVPKNDRSRIWSIIERNNAVAKILSTPQFRGIVKKERELSGNISLGYVFCIDGRIPAIFLGGRFARHFEIPAGEISTIKRKSDKVLIPDSSDLNEALRRTATTGEDLLEIVFAHTSLSDPHHGCGAMAAKRKAGLLDPKLSLEEANLKIIKENSIAAITNIYNEFRSQMGFEPLKVVGMAALYDTDTFGILLNFDNKEVTLSSTDLANKYKERMDDYFIKKNLVYGSFKERFADLKNLTPFSQNVLYVSQSLLSSQAVPELSKEIKEYIEANYTDLTAGQKKALTFVLIRNIAFQYLTGSSVRKKVTEHPFFEHQESCMAVTMRGTTIGKFDPQNQVFASTPADPKQAIGNIKTMISILGNPTKQKPHVLFVCNSVNRRDFKEFNAVLQRLMGSNAGLLRDIIADKELGEMIEGGLMIPVPILIEEDAREVLKVVDHSGYI